MDKDKIDIRWQQRFDNYNKALGQLKNAVALAKKRDLSELEQQGLVQAFEYTHELAWKTLKDFLEDSGNKEIYGSKDATREAFRLNLIEGGEVWMNMIKSRNQTSHTYNQDIVQEIVLDILNCYYNEFINLQKKLETLKK